MYDTKACKLEDALFSHMPLNASSGTYQNMPTAKRLVWTKDVKVTEIHQQMYTHHGNSCTKQHKMYWQIQEV